MRPRVTVTTLRRVERLEQFRSRVRPQADYPPMLDLDTWESIAEAQQARLMGGHEAHVGAE